MKGGEVLLTGVTVGIAVYCWWRFISWGMKKEKETDDYTRLENNFYDIGLAAVISGIILFVLVLTTISSLIDKLPQALLNPEWQAIQNIMQLVAPNK